MKTKNICIFPYGPEVEFFSRYNDLLLPEYSISACVVPMGWEHTSSDRIPFYHHLEEVKTGYDIILIPHFYASEELENALIEEILELINFDKNIVCSKELNLNNKEKLRLFCKENQTKFLYLPEKESTVYKGDSHETRCRPIDVPVIVIAGLWEQTNKFEISLGLRKQFRENEFSITQIGSRDYSELFGFHSFPKFMYSPGIPEREKICLFNQYVRSLVDEEKSDAVIITIPGAVAPFSDDFPGDYGVLAFLVAHALSVDYFILSTLFGTLKEEFIEKIFQFCQYTLGAEADCFHASNCFIDSVTSRGKKEVDITRMAPEAVATQLEQLDVSEPFPVFDATTEAGQKELFQSILDKLSAETIQVI